MALDKSSTVILSIDDRRGFTVVDVNVSAWARGGQHDAARGGHRARRRRRFGRGRRAQVGSPCGPSSSGYEFEPDRRRCPERCVRRPRRSSRCRCGFGADRAGVCQRVGKPRPIGSPNNSSASARCSAVLSKRSRPVLNVGPRQIRSGTGGCAGHTCAAEPDLGRGGL